MYIHRAMYIRSCVCGVSDDILYKLKQRCSPRFFHTGVITATKFSTFCRPKQSHESLRIPPQTLGSPQSEISIAIRKWKGMPHVCHYPKPLLLRATSVPSESAYPVCSCHFAPIYISDLQYDRGGVLFDIKAPIFISDLQYDIGGVLYDK